MPSVPHLGRLFVALALAGFGLENIAFGHYVVARAAPWPASPAGGRGKPRSRRLC
jgi:hypothetical protein